MFNIRDPSLTGCHLPHQQSRLQTSIGQISTLTDSAPIMTSAFSTPGYDPRLDGAEEHAKVFVQEGGEGKLILDFGL